MCNFFEYCFYYLATSTFFKKVNPQASYIPALSTLSLCMFFNCLSLLLTYSILFDKKIIAPWIGLIIALLIYFINFYSYYGIHGKKYISLLNKYANDTSSKRYKNRWILLYIIFSFITTCILIILKWFL